MSKVGDSFITAWMALSVIAGIGGGLYTYFIITKRNFNTAGAEGIKYFILMYLVGWVVFRVARYTEQTRPDSQHNDETKED